MTGMWYHIYPSQNSLQNITIGNFILEFKDTLKELPGIDLHEHNRPIYAGREINEAFVKAIYLVTNSNFDNLSLTNIADNKQVTIQKTELENGRFYSSLDKNISNLLPLNWVAPTYVWNFTLPPSLEIYYVMNSGMAYLDTDTIDKENNTRDKNHPTYQPFLWTIEKKDEISALAAQLELSTDKGKKSVIALFEDQTVKELKNTTLSFIPSLNDK